MNTVALFDTSGRLLWIKANLWAEALNLAVANVALPTVGKAFDTSRTVLNLIAVGLQRRSCGVRALPGRGRGPIRPQADVVSRDGVLQSARRRWRP